ncbi:MAG TPA: amino acid adenylation domain-containing protein [Streptosporangiaceae bacterium]|nr:amino acid adenylation domain-containing protein [Streptosporangiaceae bacterium]
MSDDDGRINFPSDIGHSGKAAHPAPPVPVISGILLRHDVEARCAKLRVKPDALLLAAYALTLSRWTGTRNVLVQCPSGPRTVEILEDQNTEDFVCAVHELLEGQPAFGVDSGAAAQVSFGPVAARENGFDVSLHAGWGRSNWHATARCGQGIWTAEELSAFAADLLSAASELAVVSGPVENIRCISPERHALLHGINQTGRDFSSASLDELFRQVARRQPGSVAVREGENELTYAQLAHAAAIQAQHLHTAGTRPGDTVLIGLPRSIAEVVAVLGTILAGATYVGVDCGLPSAYFGKIVTKCAPAAALCCQRVSDRLPAEIPAVATWSPGWLRGPAPGPASGMYPDPAGRLAYIAFTSGSAGAPKGVCVPHRGVARLALGADYIGLVPGDRMLRLSPLAFDASTLELWGTLLNGAALEVCTDPLPSPTELGEFITERRVTVAWLTAGLFRLVAQYAPDSLGGLRHLVTGGDVVSPEHVRKVLKLHPGLTITNGYGPTENTTFTATYSVTSHEDLDGPLPIGTPVPGTRVYVLDHRGRLVPPGAIGELYTSGDGLAAGYLGDEAETRRRFGWFSSDVADRLYRTGDLVRMDGTGRLSFLGRKDDQIKLRGYRIELSAVAAAIMALPGVQDAVAIAAGTDSAAKRLVAGIVPAVGAAPSTRDLRLALERQLPSYMVPTLWAVLDKLPLTSNGKIDRKALADWARPPG